MAKIKKKTTKLVKKAEAKATPKKGKAKINGKAVTTLRRCPCCGEETKSYWKMGHDGRFAGWAAKITKGKMSRDELPSAAARRVMEIYLDSEPPVSKVEAAIRYEEESRKAAKKVLANAVNGQLIEGQSKLQNAA